LDTGLCTIDSQNAPLGIRDCRPLTISPYYYLSHGLLNQPTILGRAAWMRRHSYNITYKRAEDQELWCRAVLRGDCRFERLPEPLLFYREEGSISLSKVLTTHACVRRTIRRYGPRLVGVPRTWSFFIQSYLKSTAWRVADACGVPELAYQRRSRNLDDEERQRAESALQAILRTEVPGLPRPAEETAALDADRIASGPAIVGFPSRWKGVRRVFENRRKSA
jgi:hypothetical protein